MTESKIVGSMTGLKAFTLGDLDNWMDMQVDRRGESLPQDLFAAVAWTFWCVNIRADAVAGLPYKIYTMDSDEDTEENEVDFDLDLTQPLWLAEAWMTLLGAAYWLKRNNRVTVADLQVLRTTTMRIKEANADGPTLFEQKVGAKTKLYAPEQLVYFYNFSPFSDFGPGVSSGGVARLPGDLVRYSNQWAVTFFENGAVPAVLLTTDGQVPKGERERIESTWNKALRGVGKWFKTILMTHGLHADIIQPPVGELGLPELEDTKRRQILAAHKVPPGLGEHRTNVSDRNALQFEFWTQCVIPEVKIWLQPAINEQLLNPLGYRIGWDFKSPEAVQAKELEKAESASFYVAGVADIGYKANVISVDEYRAIVNRVLVMGDMPELDQTFTPEERAVVAPIEDESQGGAEVGPAVTEPGGEVAKATGMGTDLDKWRTKAIKRIREGSVGKALSFESDTIPPELHSLIVYGLDRAVTLGDVVQVFDAASNGYKALRIIPDGADDPPLPIPATVEISDKEIDQALATWDKQMPEFAGLLDAEVVHKERYEEPANA